MRSGGFEIADRPSRRNRYLLMPLPSKGCQHSILCYSALKILSGPFAPERPSRSRAGSRRRMDNRVLGGRHVRVRASPRQLPPFRTNRRPLRTLLHGHGPAVLFAAAAVNIHHMDFCFIPDSRSGRLKSVRIGTYGRWVASHARYSDHAPLTVDISPAEH
jgi:hypothetical protein